MIELQRKLIGDRIRNDAFFRALRAVIRPGTTVVDLGSGTGFLAFLASRLGAKHCTLIEYGDILDVSRTLARRNGIRNCTFIRKHSMDVKKLTPVDVLVTEILGNYALEENIIEIVEDAKRFLRPGGTIIPGKITQYVCPVISDRLQKRIDVMANVGYDLDFTEARGICLQNMYVRTVKKEDLLAQIGAQRQWDLIDFSSALTPAPSPVGRGETPKSKEIASPFSHREKGLGMREKSIRKALVHWEGNEKITIFGFALWWDAELVPGIGLSTSPFGPPTHWEQIYLPLLSSITLKPGQTLELRLVSDTRPKVKINLTWEARLLSTSGKQVSSQKLDMKKGFLF